jgi:hypothetical protein
MKTKEREVLVRWEGEPEMGSRHSADGAQGGCDSPGKFWTGRNEAVVRATAPAEGLAGRGAPSKGS